MKQRVPETYRRTPPRLHPNLQHHSARASWDLSGENLKVCDFGGEIMWNLLVRLTGLNLERKTSLKSCWGYHNTTKYHIHFCIALPPIVRDLTWTCFPGIPDNQFPLARCRSTIVSFGIFGLLTEKRNWNQHLLLTSWKSKSNPGPSAIFWDVTYVDMSHNVFFCPKFTLDLSLPNFDPKAPPKLSECFVKWLFVPGFIKHSQCLKSSPGSTSGNCGILP